MWVWYFVGVCLITRFALLIPLFIYGWLSLVCVVFEVYCLFVVDGWCWLLVVCVSYCLNLNLWLCGGYCGFEIDFVFGDFGIVLRCWVCWMKCVCMGFSVVGCAGYLVVRFVVLTVRFVISGYMFCGSCGLRGWYKTKFWWFWTLFEFCAFGVFSLWFWVFWSTWEFGNLCGFWVFLLDLLVLLNLVWCCVWFLY